MIRSDFSSHLKVGRSWLRDCIFIEHYIILGWREVLTTVISTHGYIKNKTEIEVAVGCLEFSLRPEEETTED